MSQRLVDGHQARKRFGQNFLHDPKVIARIVTAIDPKPGQRLVEIGPGMGAISLPVLAKSQRLEVVELDRDLIPRLKEAAEGKGELVVHAADALKFDFSTLAEEPASLRIIGNLPYNISTPLIFHLLESVTKIRDMHFMLQKEVVERMAAGPGDEAYGRLSVMLQYWCEVEFLFLVGPGAFKPAPKVDSAIVRLTPHAVLPHPARDPALLERLIATAFNQRRKTLRNTLKEHVSEAQWQELGIDPVRRAETLELKDFVAIANLLAP
ncbi:MAG: 16S rRNA (adenine(1518)-N(6)/adenine(1519)-N(6))-dimethyltransferase RsmA [Gammaproteobacteria bacterium]|nr:16S rRNA (adenine(1518)-N(6)/adenine(1519)-N(6))-dimethyltransferase RsmA [Gammaproteobacteria bacterium]